MGICASCFGRRKRQQDDDREPLLPAPPPRPRRLKAADALAALRTGKLPSQDQIDVLARRLLKNSALNDLDGLSPEGKRIVIDLREFLQAVLAFGLQKNHDNILQELIYRSRTEISGAVHEVGDAVAETSDDAVAFLASVKQLIHLLLTSTAFRMIVTSTVLLLRQVVSSTAQQVQVTAEGVEAVAQGVEKAATEVEEAVQVDELVEMDSAKLQKVVNDVVSDVKVDMPKKGQRKQADDEVQAEDVIVNELQQILRDARQTPEYLDALRTIVSLTQKYTSQYHRPQDRLHTEGLHTVSSLFETLLERIALPTSFTEEQTQRLQSYLARVQSLLSRPTNVDPDELRGLVRDFHLTLFPDVDPTAMRLLGSLEVLLKDITEYLADSSPTRALGNLSGSMWKDLRSHLIPHVLSALWRADEEAADGGGNIPLPLPRVEFVEDSAMAQVVVDGRMMWGGLTDPPPPSFWESCCGLSSRVDHERERLSTQILPSTVKVQRWEETNIDMAHGGIGMTNRVHVRLEDAISSDRILTLSNVQYFVQHGGVLAYEDEGVFDLRIRGGGGVLIDVDLELDVHASTGDRNEFKVSDVQITLPPEMSIYPVFMRTRHSLLSRWILEPLMKAIVKQILRKLIEGWLTSTIDRVGKKAVAGDWAGAIVALVMSDEEGMEIHPTKKGLRMEDPHGDAVVAIGVAPQLVASKAVPEPPAVDRVVEGVEGTAREIRAEIYGSARDAVDVQERFELRTDLEGGKDGWRSDAFDF